MRLPPHIVASQQKIWMPFGMTIIRLAAVNIPCPSSGSGVVNMWWTHTPNPMNAVATSDRTIGR